MQQVVYLASAGFDTIQVICDDTDVFVLLIHYYSSQNLTCELSMVGTCSSRSTVDIKASMEKNKELACDLPAAHVLSGCDSTSYMWGIGKMTVIKKLKAGHHLNLLGKHESDMKDVLAEATSFIAACYGSRITHDMSSVRYDIWTTKMAKKRITLAPALKCLPPTTEAFSKHVHQAHYQTMIWMSALDADPPQLDPIKYGWSHDEASGILLPVTLPIDVSPAPDEILKLIKCGCSSSLLCSTMWCSCALA